MASGSLVRDPGDNLLARGHRTEGGLAEYEFAFPLKSAGDGQTDWEWGRTYQIAFVAGPGEEFGGVTEETWMSDQVLIRIGGPSSDSIYRPPFVVGKSEKGTRTPSHGAGEVPKN